MTMNVTTITFNISDRIQDSPRYTYAVFLSLIVIVGTIGNGLVVIVTVVEKKLWTLSHIIIAALSITDLVICGFFLPMCVIRLLQIDDNLSVCFFTSFLSPVMTILSTQIQAVLAVVRYKLTTSHGKITETFKRITYSVLCGCVLFDLVLYCSFVAPPGAVGYIPSLGLCSRKIPVFPGQPFSFVVLFYAAALVAIIFYWKIRNYITKFSFSLGRRQKRRNRLSLLLFRLFIAWFTGYTFVIFIRFCDKQKSYPDFIYQTAYFVLWCNSCVNPIMYNSNSIEFSKAFTKLLHKNCKSGNETPSRSMTSKSDSSNKIIQQSSSKESTSNNDNLAIEIESMLSEKQ